MYTFELTEKFLSKNEQDNFEDYLTYQGLDKSIWEVFSCLFKSSTKNTKPLLLKAYKDSSLYGAAIVVKCKRYGRSLFKNEVLAGIINQLNIPFYLWIRFGCCMDMMSNPGFIKDSENANEVLRAMIKYLKEHSILTMIYDYTENIQLYDTASLLPSLPHGLIDVSYMTSMQDYIMDHKNINRKMKTFSKKGGKFNRVDYQLNKEQISSLKKCFLSTSEKSVFYLPYQELYLKSTLKTSSTYIENVYYFIATLNGELLGYQAAVKTGNYLNALHGAFDRNRKTTYHAYDILFVKMTEFAIENKLKQIDFGAVLNFTKQKMINKSIDMSYFVMSKYSIVQWLFKIFIKITRIQSDEQLKFKNSVTSN